ncbi:MAG: hypothetical protein D6727_07800 [Gammaproteobacteria bacterium]|nr:MAG: hypothetical protein D6727_07800 [Gammaproteobacteria bacterium]
MTRIPTCGAGILLLVALLQPLPLRAESPRYSYLGASYEWTDVKFGVGTNNDVLNHGKFEGPNIEGAVGLTGFLHAAGQYFDGDCRNCLGFTRSNGEFVQEDLDFSGFKLGIGANPDLPFIGKGNTDLLLRVSYVDTELKGSFGKLSSNGWSGEAKLRAQLSDRAEIVTGVEYFDLDETTTTIVLGLGYEIAGGLTLRARGVLFNNETGLDVGLRWYFGDRLFGGRDSVFGR